MPGQASTSGPAPDLLKGYRLSMNNGMVSLDDGAASVSEPCRRFQLIAEAGSIEFWKSISSMIRAARKAPLRSGALVDKDTGRGRNLTRR
jgi:hypothetical protein